MLSMYTLKSSDDASKYYQQGDYYTNEATDAYSLWIGRGAEQLGLSGAVDFAVFKNLLEGRLPSGEEMIQKQTGGHHRPGYDLTFSAPKSVSLLALVAKNEAVRLAHQEAVKEVFAQIEVRYACYRAKRQGEITLEKTDNILVAAFEHCDSREGDPQLHTHGVLMNMTQRQNGAWRTLYADELYNDKLLNGIEYRSLLAQKLKNLGYELTHGPKGTFEIKGVSPTLLNVFSKRRQQIETWLEDKELSGGLASIAANFHTRGAKSKTGLGLEARWVQELENTGTNITELNNVAIKAHARGPVQLQDAYVLAETSVGLAIEHLAQWKTHFSLKDVMIAAKGMSLCPSNDADFLKSIESKINTKDLIYIGKGQLTTPKTANLEKENVYAMFQGKDAINPILRGWVAKFVANRTLETGTERDILKFMLTSKDRHILVSTNSKENLSGVLKVFNTVCEDQRYYPRLLVAKTQNIETAKGQTGFNRVNGLDEFICSCEVRDEIRGENNQGLRGRLEQWGKPVKDWQAREIWIVEAEPSLKQINQLQYWAKIFSARIVYTQSRNLNKNQALNSLIEAGIAHKKLLCNNLSNSISQEVDLQSILKELENQNSLIAISDPVNRIQYAVNEWLEKRAGGTVLLALSKQDHFTLNQQAREGLKKQEALSDSITTEILSRVSLSSAQKKVLSSYQLGDIIHFKRDGQNGIVQGDYFYVHKIDTHRELLELYSVDKAVWWHPFQSKANHFEVFKKETRALSIGEIIRWTKSFKDKDNPHLNRIKNESAIVLDIKDKEIRVCLQNNEVLTLDLTKNQNQHWDYDYARLLKDAPEGIKSGIITLNSRGLDYNQVKELKDTLRQVQTLSTFTLVCDNKQKLIEAIEKIDSEWRFKGAEPYERKEALHDHQTVATLPVFHRLQTAYLEVLKTNPELDKPSPEGPNYSAGFRKAADIVDYIALKYSEREAVFNLADAKKSACLYGGAQVPVESIREAFDVAVAQGLLEVVKYQENKSSISSLDTLVTTKATLQMEKLCIEQMLSNQNVLTPIVEKDSSSLKTVYENFWLTKGQQEAITLTVTSMDRFIGIQGVAGAGKTTALKEINRLCMDANHSVLVIANTASAKNRAIEASGIPAMTTRQFLTKTQSLLKRDFEEAKLIYGGKRLIVLDEASLASTQDVFQLTNVVEQLDARLCLMGDVKQMGSIEAGRIFYSLIAYGLKTAVMGENVRFKDPHTVAIMQDIYAARIQDALEKLSDSILEIPDKTEALQKIVEIYCASKKEVQEQTLIITPLNQDRVFINNAIREELKKTQNLCGDPINTRVLLPRDFHQIDKTEVSSYEAEDYIRFNSQDKRAGIALGDYAKVLTVEPESHRLTLRLENGKDIYWAPKNLKRESDIEIYRVEHREWLQNDTVIFKRNNESQGIYNGDKAKIVKITGTQTELLLNNGKTLSLDLTRTQNQHLDYGYTVTAYPAQGRDVPFVLAYGECPKPYVKKVEELKIGDSIILPKKDIPNPGDYSETSKVVTVNKINDSEIALVDRYGYTYTIQAKQGRTFGYFPSFEERKTREIPKSTSQQSFLMEVSRGDLTYLVVSNVDDYQKTLLSQEPKEGALKHLDPLWPIRVEMVESLTANMTGKAKLKAIATPLPKEANLSTQRKQWENRAKRAAINPLKATDVKGRHIQAEEINRRLEGNLLGYVTGWLGKPTRVSSREARWGRNGSFSLLLGGAKVGAWCNFENGESGRGLISLYASLHGVPWKEALKTLARDSGKKIEKIHSPKQPNKVTEKDPKTRIIEAKKIYEKGVPIQGTLAEKYLREFRKIPGALPEDFRFRANMIHPFTRKSSPALLVPIRDQHRQLIGVECIFLDEMGNKLKGTFKRNGVEEKILSKVSFGIKSGGMVTVQEATIPRVLWIAEGVETALSVAKAMPNHTVVASLSAHQLKNVPISIETQKVIICADNDGANASSQKGVIKALEHYLSKGRQVYLAVPEGIEKKDFNDLIKQGGISAVQQALDKMIEIKDVKVLQSNNIHSIINTTRMKTSNHVTLDEKIKTELER